MIKVERTHILSERVRKDPKKKATDMRGLDSEFSTKKLLKNFKRIIPNLPLAEKIAIGTEFNIDNTFNIKFESKLPEITSEDFLESYPSNLPI